MKSYITLATILLSAGLFSAQAVFMSSNPAGQELAAQLRNAQPEQASEITGVLKIRSAAGKIDVPVRAKVVVEQGKWKTIYTTSPTPNCAAFQAVIVHSLNSPNQYFFSQSRDFNSPAPEPMALSPNNVQQVHLAGSDFSLADLGLEFLHWPEQNRMTGQLRLGRDCYLLESQKPNSDGMVRVKSWIDKESNGVLVAEGFNKDGKLVKKFSLSGSNFKKINGRWQLEKMTIYSPRNKSETTLQFDLPKN